MSEPVSQSDAVQRSDSWRLVDLETPAASDAIPEPACAEPTELPPPAGHGRLAPTLPLKLNGRLTRYSVRKVRHRWLSSLAPWRDRRLGDACGLWLAPCNVVHTLGLWHAVDVVFLKADGTIARVAKRVPPWRFVSCSQASSALRLRAGTVKLLRLRPGMALDLAT